MRNHGKYPRTLQELQDKSSTESKLDQALQSLKLSLTEVNPLTGLRYYAPTLATCQEDRVNIFAISELEGILIESIEK